MACGQTPSDAHHVTTKGSGGHDVPNNLMPLCRIHHSEWHAITKGSQAIEMAKRYPIVKNWLIGAERWDVIPKPATPARRSGKSST